MDSNIIAYAKDKFYEIFDLTDALNNMFSWIEIDEIKMHGYRVSKVSSNIAEKMGLGKEEIEKVKICGLLHDIGKFFIKPEILNKKTELNKEEFSIIKKHVVHSKDYMIKKGYNEYSDIVLYHHERVDGSGYYGLTNNEIPLISKIIAMADVYDALNSNRAYRKAYKKETTLKIIEQEKYKFDKDVYKAFSEIYVNA